MLTTGCGKGLCEWHSTEWPRIREQQAILEICEVPKAEILNSQFKSVFTPHSGNTFPQLPGTQIKPLHISENCVSMLLDRIDVSKSSEPDKLPGRLLQYLAKEITPVDS